MIDKLIYVLTLITALGCGLVGGVFFAFSAFVMPALARLLPPQGIAAMQSINVMAVTPAFMGALFGAAACCVALLAASLLAWQRPGAACLLAGALAYLVGSIGVTMAFNVPRNNALAIAAPDSPEGARLWPSYVAGWTTWNHVRTAACIVAATLFTAALR